jgi:tetratricopeptide (TPR) repeat protein
VPLVGRAAELARVRTVLDRAGGGEGQVLGLTGDAGVGKSRLAAETARLARERGFEVHRGACLPHDSTAYLVWQPIWRTLLGLEPSLDVAGQQVWLKATVAQQDHGSARRAPLLAAAVGVPMPNNELTASLEPSTWTELLQSLLLDRVRALAAVTPLLLVLEDCQWIDPASLALLEFLARNLADQPVLIIAASRTRENTPADFVNLAFLPHFTEVRVAELPIQDAERLVVARVQRLLSQHDDISAAVVRQLVTWAGGNPLHIEELIAFLFAPDTGSGEPRVLAGMDRPEDLRRLVLARIERLGTGERAVIEVASVLGATFSASWIWGAEPALGTPELVLRHLDRLTELELVQRSPDPQADGYAFNHAITQEAVYESLSSGQRAALHEAVAAFLELSSPDRPPQLVDTLAHHYGHGCNLAKQRTWLRAAAEAARETFDLQKAIRYYQALALIPGERTGELLVELGDLLCLASSWTEAQQAYLEALEIAGSTDPRTRASAIRGLGSVLPYVGPEGRALEQAVDHLRRAVVEFERLEDRQGLAKTLERLAWTSWEIGDLPGAMATAERQHALATQAGDQVSRSAALETMGVVRWLTGDYNDALSLLEEALEVATGARYRPGIIRIANDLGGVCFERGDHLRAIRHFHRAVSVAVAIGDRRMAGRAIGNLGEAHRRYGEYGRALLCFAQAFRAAAETGDRTSLVIQAGNLAMTVAAQGRESEAQELYAHVVRIAPQVGARFALCEWRHQQARLLEGAGRLAEAERANQDALEIASELQQGTIELQARLLSLRLRVALGHMERGGALREARGLLERLGEPSEHAAVLDALWQLDQTQEQVRREASRLYRDLYQQTPMVEYREAYQRLTGASLPPARPLPRPPDSLGRTPLPLPEVLAQLDLAFKQEFLDVREAS